MSEPIKEKEMEFTEAVRETPAEVKENKSPKKRINSLTKSSTIEENKPDQLVNQEELPPEASPEKNSTNASQVETDYAKYSVPSVNVPERIILVIDSVMDENCTPFLSGDIEQSPLVVIKRVIRIFVQLKHRIDPNHQFAIVLLTENESVLLLDFTNNVKHVLTVLDEIKPCQAEDVFNLNSVFHLILNHVNFPQPKKFTLPPRFTLRVIVFYARSYTIPLIEDDDDIYKDFLKNEYCFCDVVMTHEPIEVGNNAQKICDILQKLNAKGTNYFMPVCRDMRKIHKCIGRLLGHPFQRPLQKHLKI